MHFSSFDAKFNLTLAKIIATGNSQDVKAQLMLFYTIYTNLTHKLLVGIKKPAIFWDKFKRLILRKNLKIA